MKLRSVVAGLLTFGFAVLPCGISFAKEGHHKEDAAAFVKLLNDSASALQASNPALATGLAEWAKKETKEIQQKKSRKEKKELEGKNEEAMKVRREAHLKLLRDSAAALQQSHPDLAAKLSGKAEQKAKWLEKEAKEDAKEAAEKAEK